MNKETDISSSKFTEIISTLDDKKCKYPITKIKDLPRRFDFETDNILIEAYIFGIDMLVHERGIIYLTLKLSDMTDNLVARLVISSKSLEETLEKIKIGSSWRFYGECANKQFDGMSIIKMQQIPKINESLIDKEQEKYFFFEKLDIETVKKRKKEILDKVRL